MSLYSVCEAKKDFNIFCDVDFSPKCCFWPHTLLPRSRARVEVCCDSYLIILHITVPLHYPGCLHDHGTEHILDRTGLVMLLALFLVLFGYTSVSLLLHVKYRIVSYGPVSPFVVSAF